MTWLYMRDHEQCDECSHERNVDALVHAPEALQQMMIRMGTREHSSNSRPDHEADRWCRR